MAGRSHQFPTIDFPKRWQYLVLCCIVLLGFFARIKPTLSPNLDRSLWKEIDYIVISQNYAAHGMHFLQPEINWPAEPPRITAMEFPAVPYGAAFLYELFGFQTATVRLIPLVAFLLMPVYLFFLVRDEMGPLAAFATSLIAVLMPIHHQFGRILFSEPVSICMSVAALFHFNRWAKLRQPVHAVCSAVAFSLAVAVKFEPLFMLLPLTYVWWRYRGIGKSAVVFCLWLILCLAGPAAWMLYAYHLSQTSIDVFGVVPFLHGHNKLQTLTLTRSYRFWLALGHRVWILSWGLLGVPFEIVGLLVAIKEKGARLLLVYCAAIACYFVVVAEGQIDASYRQLNAVPVLSFLMAIGILTAINALFIRMKGSLPPSAKPLIVASAAVIIIIALPSYWAVARENPLEPAHPRAWALAQQIQTNSLPGNYIVALGEYTAHVGGNDVSPVLYYYSHRQGWTLNETELSEKRIDSLIGKGATLLAVDNEFVFDEGIKSQQTKDFIQNLCRKYPVIYRSGDALLLRLTPTTPRATE